MIRGTSQYQRSEYASSVYWLIVSNTLARWLMYVACARVRAGRDIKQELPNQHIVYNRDILTLDVVETLSNYELY